MHSTSWARSCGSCGQHSTSSPQLILMTLQVSLSIIIIYNIYDLCTRTTDTYVLCSVVGQLSKVRMSESEAEVPPEPSVCLQENTTGQLLNELWQGGVPTVITLAKKEIASTSTPDDIYVCRINDGSITLTD